MNQSHEFRREVLKWLCLVAFLGATTMGVLDFRRGQPSISVLEIGFGIWGLMLYLFLDRAKNLVPWSLTLLLPFSLLIVYANAKIESTQTTFVWVQTIPVFSYLMLGRRWGLLFSIIFVTLGIVFYLPRLSPNPADFITELLDLGLASLVIVGFAHIYDRSRDEAFSLLVDQAEEDALTGIKNRRGFEITLKDVARTAKRQQLAISVAVIDLDHFKRINDQYGHAIGDKALCHAVDFIRARTRSSDVLGRLGGEEFAICMLGCTAEQCIKQLDQLRQAFAETPLQTDDLIIAMSFSAGVAQLGVDGDDLFSLFKIADRRLYRAKDSGRNRVVGKETGKGD
ncbi:GGDEF domain-containing protein [Spongiibacter sp. KMU-158]|uniref:diguanylate cyclase n=1 Tax=Spongiibacter pelagi TaxID=2760804 RepID=A0A927C5Z1_9GAMM|nr:GGDEF domain-containing protein [Spongiibacter pelagi]MBD2860186.1 GGDEF domain-containing protein [Spongiibacter pelagi]